MMRSTLFIALALVVIGTTGCAGHAERYRQGLEWHLSNEAHKAELERQGFPQYSNYY